MSQDWDFYPLLVDSEPASIYLDLGLARTAPKRDQPHMAYVRIRMRQPRPDGLSSNEEFEALTSLEDALVDGVARINATTFAGRNTSSGSRDFYFYTADPASFGDAVAEAMARHPEYQFEIGNRLDPDWEVYFEFLYPSADDLQRILSRRVTEALAAHGDKLVEPRTIDHFAYFPSHHAAASLRDDLRERGFIVDEPNLDGDWATLTFKRVDRPCDIDGVVLPIARRIQELGGEYDGWGCEVVT